MKKALLKPGLVLFLFSATFSPPAANGTPTIALYFDRALTRQSTDCPDSPPGTVLDTLYVAASGFTSPLEGIEYSIVFPPEIVWLGDVGPDNGLNIGEPVNGLSKAFFAPIDASGKIIIREILILWVCDGCATQDIEIAFAAHPATGSLRAVNSNLMFEDVVGQSAWVCVTCVGCNSTGHANSNLVVAALPTSEQCVLDCPAGDGGVILPGDPPGQHHSPDLDGDGTVIIVDFALFAVGYPLSFDPDKDFYCSGNLDLIDFVLFTRHWGHTRSVPVKSSTWSAIKARYLD